MRVAVVLGASRGIGRATALHLHTKGHMTVLSARSKDTLDEVVEMAGGRDIRDSFRAMSRRHVP